MVSEMAVVILTFERTGLRIESAMTSLCHAVPGCHTGLDPVSMPPDCTGLRIGPAPDHDPGSAMTRLD